MTHQLRLALAAALATLLTALALDTLFSTRSWVGPTILLVLLTVAACEGARRLAAPRPLVPLVGAAAAGVAATLLFARDSAWFGLVPTPSSVAALGEVLAAGFVDIETYAAPLVPGTGMVLIAAGGTALVALVVDTVAVSYRRPALAGLALLGLYAVPAALSPAGVPWLTFALAAAGYLGLLVVDSQDKVTRWGRQLSGGTSPAAGAGTLSATGRRIGVAAVGGAIVLPLVAPGPAGGFLAGGDGWLGGGGQGRNVINASNPVVDLGRNLNLPTPVEVMRYRSSADDPGYIRLVSLDDFNGTTWEPRSIRAPQTQTVDRGLARPPGLASDVASTEVTTDIQLESLESTWLPLPYPATIVTGLEGRWLWEESTFNVYSADDLEGQDYTVSSLQLEPTPEQLRGAGDVDSAVAGFTELPDGMPPLVLQLAQDVTAGHETAFDKAVALQSYLRSPRNFAYDEQAPEGMGMQALDNFLREGRGFCVHFSSAMAVMARSLDIPARVVVGWTPGSDPDGDGTYSVTTDAFHAWPELYFEGVGWVAFEPTPARRTGQPPAYTQVEAPSAAAAPTPTSPAAADPNLQPERPQLDEGEGSTGDEAGAFTRTDIPWTGLGVTALVAAVLLAPAAARRLVRRHRWSSAGSPAGLAAAAWHELRDETVDHGIVLPESLTPRQFAAGIAQAVPLTTAAEQALGRVARAAERYQYAPDVGDVGDLRGDVATIAGRLRATAGRWQRLRARVLPASTLVLVRRGLEEISVRLEGAGAAARSLGARLRPRRARAAAR